jgi:cytochrome c
VRNVGLLPGIGQYVGMELDIRHLTELAQFRDRIRDESAVQFGGTRGADHGCQARLYAAWYGRFGEQNHDGPHSEIVEYRFTQFRRNMIRFTFVTGLLALALCSLPAFAGDKKGDPEKGKETFQQCAVCHNADSTEKKMGPGLKGLFSREKMNNGKKPTEANVRAKVDEGGNGMPAYKEMLSDDEKDDLIAYLKTL